MIVLRAREMATAAVTGAAGVTPTIAQTTPPAPSGSEAVPTSASARTVLEEPLVRAPLRLVEPRPLEPTPLPTTSTTTGAHGAPVVVLAVVLASAAFALLAGVLITHFAERSGKRNGEGSSSLGLVLVDAAVAPQPPASLTPETVVLPPQGVPSIAPLEPSPSEAKRHKR